MANKKIDIENDKYTSICLRPVDRDEILCPLFKGRVLLKDCKKCEKFKPQKK